ncbi:hypothetical protein ZIOFF_066599 [Zingiber officinale]|uniref:Uncharacterized protein n=1 Tax=Zingiber officinale TaxID=94328 RepID=A0A8J5KC82_ZINOF|nr:hypothetical protein ZIOFF_066599 [Zingiber officinale]
MTQLADQLGFEIIVNKDNVRSDVGQFTWLVNSVDVMLGVHNFGLTNLLFLPPNATLIQMVSWGGLEWMTKLDFGQSTKDMKLNYVQYIIAIEERSLIEQYARDHMMFKDPSTSIKLDIKNFKNAGVVALNKKALCSMVLERLAQFNQAWNKTLVTNLCSMYELAYVNHINVKKTQQLVA